MTNDQRQMCGPWAFVIRHSFVIGHSSFVIPPAILKITPKDNLLFMSVPDYDAALNHALDTCGVQADFWDIFGRHRRASQGTKLSGGEQQMLAIGRILRTGARLLLLDEPTEGLAPVIVQQIGRTISRLKAEGFTILLVEQNFRFASRVADRHYVMEGGRVVDMIPNSELESNLEKVHEYLGV